MKKYLLFLVAAILATVARAADGDTFIYRGGTYEVISEKDHTVALCGYDEGGVMPQFGSTAQNGTTSYTITAVKAHAFEKHNRIELVMLSETVTEIGEYAFSECPKLQMVSGFAVTEIKNSTFANCSSLVVVPIPESVTKIGERAFYACSSLQTSKFPASVTEIGESAFYGCSSLPTITIPASVTEIGERAFSNCTGLSKIVVEKGNPNYISEGGVLFNIDKTQLIQCPGAKKEEYSIPSTVNKIGVGAFCGCGSLTSITIPESVTEIGESAFEDCSSLNSVTIPNSVIGIATNTFSGCSRMTSVTISSSVTEIGESAFEDCSGLRVIYNLNPTPQKTRKDAFKNVRQTVIVYIPKGSYNDYFLSSDWVYFTDFREMGALEIALSKQNIELTAGNTATITATVTKDDEVTVESEKWSSSNPEVATVDNGVITAVGPGEALIQFTAVDGYGLSHTEACKVTVSEGAGVAEVVTDADAPVDVYNLQGVAVLRDAAASELGNLPAGLYIVRQGKSVKKIAVK